MIQLNRQVSESYFIGLLLAVAGGYLDVYTYISRGGVFANAQTGNIVLLGIHIAQHNFEKITTYTLPLQHKDPLASDRYCTGNSCASGSFFCPGRHMQ